MKKIIALLVVLVGCIGCGKGNIMSVVDNPQPIVSSDSPKLGPVLGPIDFNSNTKERFDECMQQCMSGEDICPVCECPDDDDGGDSICVGKIWVCHIPPGNPEQQHDILIGCSALDAHLAHGDYIGGCQ